MNSLITDVLDNRDKLNEQVASGTKAIKEGKKYECPKCKGKFTPSELGKGKTCPDCDVPVKVMAEGKVPKYMEANLNKVIQDLIEQDDEEDEMPAEEPLDDEEDLGVKSRSSRDGEEELSDLPEPEEVVPDKMYLGNTDDKHFYFEAEKDGDSVEDYRIVDQEGELVYSAKDAELEVDSVTEFLLTALPEVQVQSTTWDVFSRFVIPYIDKLQKELEGEEITPEEFDMEDEEEGEEEEEDRGALEKKKVDLSPVILEDVELVKNAFARVGYIPFKEARNKNFVALSFIEEDAPSSLTPIVVKAVVGPKDFVESREISVPHYQDIIDEGKTYRYKVVKESDNELTLQFKGVKENKVVVLTKNALKLYRGKNEARVAEDQIGIVALDAMHTFTDEEKDDLSHEPDIRVDEFAGGENSMIQRRIQKILEEDIEDLGSDKLQELLRAFEIIENKAKKFYEEMGLGVYSDYVYDMIEKFEGEAERMDDDEEEPTEGFYEAPIGEGKKGKINKQEKARFGTKQKKVKKEKK